jgi:Cu(I)/Ag(I) efflux system membrane protein CusA/SilA
MSGGTTSQPAAMGTAAEPEASGPNRIRTLQTENSKASVSKRAYIPLGQLASIEMVPGPPMISSENAQLRSIVFLNVRGRDMGGFVGDAKEVLAKELKLPKGYSLQWSGQWENQIRAQNRLMIIVPVVFVIIFMLLYFTFKSWVESALVMLSVPFALIGGVYLQYLLGYNFSVAVWVGYISLYGVAVQTGVMMVVFLHEALDKRLASGGIISKQDIYDATFEGSALRLRPKLMTVATTLLGLLPIMLSTGVGSDVMKPIAAPSIGGMLTSAIHVLLVTPVIFTMMKEHALKKGKLKLSEMAEWMK